MGISQDKMSIITLETKVIALKHCIECELCSLMRKIQAKTTTPQEPDYIAELSLTFPHSLARVLKQFFPKHRLSVTGVFCHQKPLAFIAKDNSYNFLKKDIMPELGDLLIVYLESINASERIINSLLLQAKKLSSFNVPKRVPKGEKHQLLLYTKWPEFEYRRAGKLNGNKRNIYPKAIHSGAEYLFIRDNLFCLTNGMCHSLMKCAVPSSLLFADKDFSSEIVDLLRFRSGRVIDDYRLPQEDGWSNVVWDLLSVCRDVTSRRRNIGRDSFGRLTEDAWSNDSNQPPSIFDSFDANNGNGDNSNEENGGISTIIIENLGNNQD